MKSFLIKIKKEHLSSTKAYDLRLDLATRLARLVERQGYKKDKSMLLIVLLFHLLLDKI